MKKSTENTGNGIKKPIYPKEMVHRARMSLSMCLVVLLCVSMDAFAQEADGTKELSKVSAKVKVSLGYDNNVLDRKENKLDSRFLQIYINSDVSMLPTGRTLLSLRLQDGIKYLDAPSLSGESVLINDLNFCIAHKVTDRFIPEALGGVRGRTSIHSKSGVSPSEEAYLRGFAGLALKAVVNADLTGRVFCNYNITNFEDFDPFDRRGPEIGLRADLRLLPGSTTGVQYSRGKARFDRWNEGKASRTDTADDVSLCVQFYRHLLLDFSCSYERNRSDVSEYSYSGSKFTLLLAKSLPWEIMLQLYALVRSRGNHSNSDGSAATQEDLEDEERGMLTVKVSRDISEHCTLEAQYDLRRNRLKKEDRLYTKNVFLFSLALNF